MYLTINSGVYEQSSHIYCSVAECFLEKPRWCSIEHVCQGIKGNTALSNAEDLILRYIKTYLLVHPMKTQTNYHLT